MVRRFNFVGRNLQKLGIFDNKVLRIEITIVPPKIECRTAQHSQWSSLSLPLVSDHHFPNFIFHLSWEGEGGGEIHKRHLAFDLIKVKELATQVYLLVVVGRILWLCV